jgi:hypothetical protein
LCVGVFGDAVVVSRPDHGWAPPGGCRRFWPGCTGSSPT